MFPVISEQFILNIIAFCNVNIFFFHILEARYMNNTIKKDLSKVFR